MRTFFIMILLSMGSLGLFVGCEDILSTEPSQSVSPEVALEDISGVQGLVRSTYSRNQNFSLYGNLVTIGPDLLADHGRLRSGASRHIGLVFNDVGSHLGSMWSDSYQLINDANTVIAALPDLDTTDPDISEALVTRLNGEMHFIRALTYHNLVKAFGYEPGMEVDGWDRGVVIRTEPTRGVQDADERSRSSNTEVYNLIKSDLDQAISDLEQGDRGSRYYASYGAALGLRARVALYERDWSGASNFASLAMENAIGGLVSGDDYASASLNDPDGPYATTNIAAVSTVFDQAPNPESMFEIAILTQRESLGVNNALSPYLLPAQWHANYPSQDLVGLFEDSDVRRLIYPFDDVEHNERYTIKYNQSNDQWTDNVPVIRYPEMLLIRAEAELEMGNSAQALEDLNTLREARGASQLSSVNLQTVMQERSRELAFEGHRFFDLKRRGMDIRKPEAMTGPVPYSDFRVLANIPSSALDSNDQLVQNPGY